jgi:hyperosmotically inducible protein
MRKSLTYSLVALGLASVVLAQDGPLRRAGQALDSAGKNIRHRVESEVARGQTLAHERDLLGRVSRRIEWDKQLVGSALQLEVRPDNTVVVRGSAVSDAAKRRALDIIENTIGVTTVVDAMAVAREVKVIESRPSARVIELSPPIPAEPQVAVPPETKAAVKP